VPSFQAYRTCLYSICFTVSVELDYVTSQERRAASEKRGGFQGYDALGAFHNQSSGLVCCRPSALRPTLPGEIPFAISPNCSSGSEGRVGGTILLILREKSLPQPSSCKRTAHWSINVTVVGAEVWQGGAYLFLGWLL
jgi:hypothetical protein